MLSLCFRNQNILFRFHLLCQGSAKGFSLTSNKFRMVYKVHGNPQPDSRDWSILKTLITLLIGHSGNDIIASFSKSENKVPPVVMAATS